MNKKDILRIRSNSAMHASPHLSFSEPEKDNQNQKPSKEKWIDEFDKENVGTLISYNIACFN